MSADSRLPSVTTSRKPYPFWIGVFGSVMGFAPMEAGLGGGETAEWQHLYSSDAHSLNTTKSLQGDCARSIFQNVPRRRRSKKSRPKEFTKVLDFGKKGTGIFPEHQSKNHFIVYQRRPREKKGKLMADSSNDDVNFLFRVRGERRGLLNSFKDFSNDNVSFHFQVRGERRGPLNSSKQGKLNSNTFQNYMEHIWSNFPGGNKNLFLYLDSLWFSLYSQKSFKEKVLNWVKKKEDMFSKKYVLIPIVMWSHWSLLILCNFGESPLSKSISPCMLLLDSLHTANPKRLEPGIRKFVFDIYNIHQRPGNMESIHKVPLLVPKVPQQRNGEECGSFVLYYISLFLQNAPEDFSSSKGYPYFMKEDWFTPEEFDNFCRKLEVESNTKNSLSSDE